MSTWRNLLTPNVSKYMDSQHRENSLFNTVETPINNESTSFSKEIYEISSKRIETSEFGDGETKKLKYQEKLDQIQKEILALKKQNNTFSSKASNFSKANLNNNNELIFASLESAEKSDFNLFLKKTNGQQTSKKSRKCSIQGRKVSTNKKKNPSYLSIKDFNISTEEIKRSKDLNSDPREFDKNEENLSNSLRTQSLDNLEYGLNLTNIVKSLQEKLKKEIYLRLEINKQLKKSKNEITHLKSYISKLEKQFEEIHTAMSSPKNEKQTSKIYENKIKNEAKNQQDPQNKTAELNRENKKKILELSNTKTYLLDSIDKILQMFTSEKEKEDNLMSCQKFLEEKMQKFKLCKKKFNSKKHLISKISHNYDLPLKSNEISKSSSLKEEESKIKETLSDIKETATNKKLDTSNNLVYTPSHFESLSFYENLKESKNSKLTIG